MGGREANGFKFDATGNQVSSFVIPGDRYNFNPDNYLQLPQERRIIGGRANYELGAGAELYVEGVYTNNIVDTKRAATPVGGSHRFQVNSPFLPGGVQDLLRALDETEGTAATRGEGFPNLHIGTRISEGRTPRLQFARAAGRNAPAKK